MSDTKELITSLDQKVEQLLTNIKEQQNALEKKKREVDELKKELTEQASNIKILKSENESLKNAPTEVKEDSEAMKVRISELVKEIDQCISLLKV